MNESERKEVYKYSIYPRDTIISADKGFVIIDIGSSCGTRWTFLHER